MTSNRKKPPEEPLPKGSKVVDEVQDPRNEAQQTPSNSGDPRTSSGVGVPLPWGVPTDDLHPITQLQGDVSDPTVDEPGTPHVARRRDQHKKSA
jgi:hypothetical protein